MDLATYGAVVSTAAFVIGLWSLWLHRARWRRDLADRQPEFSCKRRAHSELPGWEEVTLTMRNRSNAKIKAEQVRVLWPLAARIVGESAALRQEDKEAPWRPGRLLPPKESFKAMPLRLEVAHEGAVVQKDFNWPVMGSGDTHSTELLVTGAESSRLILWISFSSLDRSLRVKSRIIVT